MAGPLRKVLFLFTGIVALLVIAAISFVLLFDPNDFRDNIAAKVKSTTGRELVIEGDLQLSYFPWLAINIGKTTLGNAQGFGDKPFASFEQARLSVRVVPMLLRREVAIGTAALESFELNLAVAGNGRSNWQDLIEAGTAPAEAVESDAGSEDAAMKIDIGSIAISDASVSYSDAQTGERYTLTNFNMTSGRVARGEPIALVSGFDFELQPADLAGDFSIETDMLLDGDAGTVAFADAEISVLGIDVSADVAPFSYAGELTPTATLQVDAFSLKSLLRRLNIEVPETADPAALGKIIVDATASMSDAAIALRDLELVVDDTTLKGTLSLARNAAGTITIELAADSIDLDRYMAPAADADSASAEAVPVEIPADLIRQLNVRGNLTAAEAYLSGMKFENAKLGIRAANGDLRLHPISASFFDGSYDGDVRINASGKTPVLSVNENVRGVNLGSLAKAMFDQENITGSINGSFQLTGRGDELAAIQRSLNGSMSMELLDGAWEGTDIWYELRKARALYKKEAAPEPTLPARTEFSTVRATGPVTDGVFRNDDLLAELPFMRLTGKGSVDFAEARVDYRLTARVLERPEFAEGATEEELKEFTEAVIPLKISGPLADPSIKPDVEAMLKKEAKKKLLERLLGGDDKAAQAPAAEATTEADASAAGPAEDGATEAEPAEKKDRDKLKDRLKDLLGN
ncbi:MAG: AsmA family protein [Gammaproteobacteria bacterium]|nr:AsmA family protein [Gammaproteobacteria bacterium]